MTEVQAMVLAAGLGTRLWPLTADRAKPAVPFLGRPLVAWVLELLARHRIGRAVVNTHYQPHSVEAAARSAHGIAVAFSHEEAILGTAGALAQARDLGLLAPDRTTLIINGKLFTEIDLSAAIAAHQASGLPATMVLRRNVEREAFREVLVARERVIGFGASTAPAGADPLLFTGVHLIEPEVLAAIPSGASDTVRDTYPPLIARGLLGAHRDDRGRWWELSTLERYLALHQRAAAEGLGAEVSLGPRARISPNARVSRAVIWEDAVVEAGAIVEDAVIGAGVRVVSGEQIRRAVVVRKDVAGEIEWGEVRGGLVVVPL